MRHYDPSSDYTRVSDFLVRTYEPEGPHFNWLQPRWEYMHHHDLIHRVDLGSIGVWEADGEIVGLVHPEHLRGTVYLQLHPAHLHLREELVSYAEEHLASESGGKRNLWVFVPDFDTDLEAIVRRRGYAKEDAHEDLSHFRIPDPMAEPPLAPGFRFSSLADDDDPDKVHRLLWRGFNHPGDPPPGGREEREFMQSAPGFRKDLHVVVVSPDGDFVSYCGMWYEPRQRFAYVEPVATDPDFRRLGLAEAAVLESIRRSGEAGAKVAYVGTRMPFYLSFGFEPLHHISVWRRKL